MTSYQNLSDVLTKTSLEILGIGHLTYYSKKKASHTTTMKNQRKTELNFKMTQPCLACDVFLFQKFIHP